MPRTSPYVIRLSPAEHVELQRRAGKYTLPYFQVQRAKMILWAANGLNNDEIAERLDSRREVVSRWRKRFFVERLNGLEEQARPGRPDFFPQASSFKLKRGLANCRRLTTFHCLVGVATIWRMRSVAQGWPHARSVCP
jgi:transposase